MFTPLIAFLHLILVFIVADQVVVCVRVKYYIAHYNAVDIKCYYYYY